MRGAGFAPDLFPYEPMSALGALSSHLGLLVFTALTAIIIAYLLYAIAHPEKF